MYIKKSNDYYRLEYNYLYSNEFNQHKEKASLGEFNLVS